MATDPRIILGIRPPEISSPGQLMALRNIAQDASFRHATQRDELSKRVKQTALAAWEGLPDAPDDQRLRAYETAWGNTIEELRRSGLFQAAGVSDQEIQQAKMNIVPPEQARAAVMSLADIQKVGEEKALKGAYTFNDRGELDVEATVKKLSGKPDLAYKVLQQAQTHEATMAKRATEREEVERRRQKDTREATSEKAKTAVKLYYATLQDAINKGMPDEEARAVAQQAYAPIAQEFGFQQTAFDPTSMEIGDEGMLIHVARPKGLPRDPGEKGGPPQPPLGVPQSTKGLDWREAMIYTAAMIPKFNPQTSNFLFDPRTGQPIPNEPVITGRERVARAGVTAAEPQNRVKQEMQLRDDFRQDAKVFVQVRDAYERIRTPLDKALKAGTINAADTISAATSFMKMVDPGSVVRESELFLALSASGVIDRLMNTYNTLKQGKVLTQQQVKAFRDAAEDLYEAAEKNHTELENGYKDMAKEYGLNPGRVVPNYRPKDKREAEPVPRSSKPASKDDDPLGILGK